MNIPSLIRLRFIMILLLTVFCIGLNAKSILLSPLTYDGCEDIALPAAENSADALTHFLIEQGVPSSEIEIRTDLGFQEWRKVVGEGEYDTIYLVGHGRYEGMYFNTHDGEVNLINWKNIMIPILENENIRTVILDTCSAGNVISLLKRTDIGKYREHPITVVTSTNYQQAAGGPGISQFVLSIGKTNGEVPEKISEGDREQTPLIYSWNGFRYFADTAGGYTFRFLQQKEAS